MNADPGARGGSDRRAIGAARDALARLGSAEDPPPRRAAFIEAADAVELALRRRLRDAEHLPNDIRLRALDRDDLRPDEVLGELRRHDLLGIDTAAGVHELFEARRRVGGGGEPTSDDARLASRVVDSLEAPAAPPPPDATLPAPDLVDSDATLPEAAPAPAVAGARLRPRGGAGALIAAAALVLVVALFFVLRGRDDSAMAEGIALFRSGAYADAASRFWRYAEENPDDPTPHLYLARIHRRMGRLDLAVPEVRSALELAPDDADAHTELGFILFESGRHEEAIERFRTAIGHDPDGAEAWIGLVTVLGASDRGDAAERVLERAPDRVRERLRGAPGATPR